MCSSWLFNSIVKIPISYAQNKYGKYPRFIVRKWYKNAITVVTISSVTGLSIYISVSYS
jgi:hypothetical protein